MLAPTCVKSLSKAKARELAREVLARVGLEAKADHYPEQLSPAASSSAWPSPARSPCSPS